MTLNDPYVTTLAASAPTVALIVPAGAVTFVVTNKGHTTHDFKIKGKKTPFLSPGKSATLKVVFPKGKFPYLCTIPGHAAAGMKGVLTVR